MRFAVAISVSILLWSPCALGAGRRCRVGEPGQCPAGSYCAAVWRGAVCPPTGRCAPLLPIPAGLVVSLPFPAGERLYCGKGMLRPGRSTHNACDAATRFALDLSGTAADPPHLVLACAPGRVVVLDGCRTSDLNRQEQPRACNFGLGNMVRVVHGPLLYSQVAHLSSVLVATGARVGRGDVIGVEGNTGNAGGKHIHWSLHRGVAEVRAPGPSIPFPRIRIRVGGAPRVVPAAELHCGDFGTDPVPRGDTLLESENERRGGPPHRFGFTGRP